MRRLRSRIPHLVTGLMLAAGLASLVPSPAAAAVPHLSGQITDQAGVLDQGRVGPALDDLLKSDNVQLWVVTVNTTGSTSAPDYAQQVFSANGLGGNDFLLVLAVDDHRYGWYEDTVAGSDAGAATGLSSGQLDRTTGRMESSFRSGDYSGGIVAFAQDLGSAVSAAGQPASGPTVVTKPTAPPESQPGSGSTSNGSGDGGLTALVWFLAVLLLVIFGAGFLAAAFRVWQGHRLAMGGGSGQQPADLGHQANKLLVDTDDAVHEAQQELGFAQAEFDETDTKPFGDAITAAQAQLKQAFSIRQQLDDSTPEDPPTRTQMYNQIISLCQAASSSLADQTKRIQGLRDLERTAPDVLAAIPATIEALKGRLPAVQAAMKTLSGYAPSAWSSVKGNPEEADKRGHFAEQQVEAGKKALATKPPDSMTAAHAARAAQEAVAQANQLLDAVINMAKSLDDASGKLDAEITAAEADIAAAKASSGPTGDVSASDLAKAETLVTAAKHQAQAANPDPIAALNAAQQAHAAVDSVLAGKRQMEEERARVKAAFDVARTGADISVNQARSFIDARRNGVGQEARARLAEAERHLAQADAVRDTDMVAATSEARVATNLANSAYMRASGDFEDYERASVGPGGGGPGYVSGGGAGGGGGLGPVGGAIIGGIIGGMLSGGRGGGFGGTPWGSGGGWTGGGGGFGGFGGFGGGGHGGGSSLGGFGGGGGGGGGGHGGGGGW